MALEKKATNLKHTVIVLIGLVVVLSLSNLGTGIAAARLAKDTSVDANGVISSFSNRAASFIYESLYKTSQFFCAIVRCYLT